uniref:SGNH hydrolase-type esterase domain-containing protein n=1 Tax=Gadus morhua TaxID=8049 RepID=A0A8C5CKM3_GADMO
MPLYSDISGTETGKCTDCAKLKQTLALIETRLAAVEKCKGLSQDTVPMGEFAELTQIQQDDQSYTVSFPKLDKRETVPAASHWLRVGAKPKQHTKVNRQVHSTPNAKLSKAKVTCISRISPSLKSTLPLKNRFLPLQESTNAPATDAPLSPEMRPDGQCGQRRNNQSPRRRAAHVSATVQQGPISEKADEPDTLIIGDSTIKDITGKRIKTCIFPYGMVSDINHKLAKVILENPKISQIIVHAGFNDVQREQSELLKRDYTDLLDTLDKTHIKSSISGPIPTVDRGINRFSRLLALNTWLSRVCNERGRDFIDNFNLFWRRKYLFRADGLHPNRLGSKLLRDNLLLSLHAQARILPRSDAQATIRAQVEKKRDYSLPHTTTLPLSDTQIADSPQTLKRDNSPPDAINTGPSPFADAGLARNGHPPPLHSPIDDDLQPHLSHSHNNNSSSNVSLCDFPAEFKKLEYAGIKLASVSMIASPRHGRRMLTPRRMAPHPHNRTDSSPEYY